MIPNLLHGRLLTAPPPSGIIASPVYQQLNASATGVSSASATATFGMNPDGTWTGSATGSQNKSGLWFDPITAGAGSAYEVRITPTLTSGSPGVITNGASSFVPLSSVRQLQIVGQRFNVGQTAASYNVLVEIRPAGGGAVVSSGTFPLSTTATVTGGGGGGGGCPDAEMWMGLGLQAGDLRIGQLIDGVTADDPETKTRLQVMASRQSWQPCHRIVTSNGSACVLSDSTPFTLRDGSTLYTPDMLGQQVLREDGDGGLAWDTVEVCEPVGERRVMRINVGGESLLAGEHPGMRIVSHNNEKE